MKSPTRWATETPPGHSRWLIDHFSELRTRGQDLAGEARFVNALAAPGSHILDAGCGTGRVGSVMASFGHTVVGVDADAELIQEARAQFPDLTWLLGDLADDLDSVLGPEALFDVAVLAGNVMPYLAPNTETSVLRQIVAHLKPHARLIVGFDASLGYSLRDFDRHLMDAGAIVEHRFATWDLHPWNPDSSFAVTVAHSAST